MRYLSCWWPGLLRKDTRGQISQSDITVCSLFVALLKVNRLFLVYVLDPAPSLRSTNPAEICKLLFLLGERNTAAALSEQIPKISINSRVACSLVVRLIPGL